MYWLRAAIVSLVAFAAIYLFASLALVALWRKWQEKLTHLEADVLFLLRITPLALAYAYVALLAVPSYFFSEPEGTHEHMALAAQLIAASAVLVVSYGAFNAIRTWWKTSRFVRRCMITAQPMAKRENVYKLADNSAILLVTGFWKPKFLVSNTALSMLEQQQLEAAMRHEAAHAHHRDNLKQFLIRLCGFPGLATLDRAWLRAAEIHADDAAVADRDSALDLAAALVAVARVSNQTPELGMSLVPETDAPLAHRVQRLLSWSGESQKHVVLRNIAAGVTALAIVFAINASWFIAQAHEASELLFTK